MGTASRVALATLVAGGALAARDLWRRQPEEDLHGEVAVVTGGSRGLGFLLARELAREGCRVAVCARDTQELARAERLLTEEGLEIMPLTCDVSDRLQVEEMLSQVDAELGPVDVLLNNAGIIQVGPLAAMDEADFRRSLDIMFWGVVRPTLGVLPSMRRRRRGRIVNITSIGGKIAVPRLLPYCSAKFAAVGFSEGLRAELRGSGVLVTTVVPGLMRTGSHLQAEFKGDSNRLFTWFSLGATLPLVSMDAERAARRVVAAARRGEAEVILSLPANVAVRAHGLFPGLVTDLLGLAGRIIPAEATPVARTGGELYAGAGPWLRLATTLGTRAAARNNEG